MVRQIVAAVVFALAAPAAALACEGHEQMAEKAHSAILVAQAEGTKKTKKKSHKAKKPAAPKPGEPKTAEPKTN